jgi:hypothetical protein
MAVLPGVLGCRLLRRTVQVRLGFDFGFRISDFGSIDTIGDIELNSLDFAICSRIFHKLLRDLSIRIPQSSTQWHAHLHGLATAIHEISGLGRAK